MTLIPLEYVYFLFLLIQEPSPQVIFLSVILIKEYGLLFAYLFVF